MFRGYMPALTVLVFGIGLGIGTSWSRGLIPLSLGPAKSGSLSLEVAQREPLPPPNEIVSLPNHGSDGSEDNSLPADPTVFEQQSEPETGNSDNDRARSSTEKTRPQLISAVPEADVATKTAYEAGQQSPSVNDSAERPTRIRLRDRSTANVDSLPPKDDAPDLRTAPGNKRSVTVVAHQDPADHDEVSAETVKRETLSPRQQLALADEKIEGGEILAAHRILSKIYWNHKELRSQIQEKIDGTARAIFFQAQPHFLEPYVIQPGDRLEIVARKYQLSWEYLAKLNRTDPRRIQAGQKLKVMKGPFGAVVELKDFALTIHLQGYYVKRYPVCIGKDGASPVGKFSVLNKVENPPYTAPDGKVIAADDPANPLGERWIDLGDSYGIHGTIDPDSIGKAESRGCIRLGDREIIEVYNFLVKGSDVSIRK